MYTVVTWQNSGAHSLYTNHTLLDTSPVYSQEGKTQETLTWHACHVTHHMRARWSVSQSEFDCGGLTHYKGLAREGLTG